MILRHAVSGHQITVSDESVEFWRAAGYAEVERKKAPARKAAAKKSK